MKFSEDKKKLIIPSFLIGALLGGAMVWQFASIKFQKELALQRESFIETVSPYLPWGPEETRGLSGNIEKMDGGEIILRADPVHSNPLEEQGPETRTVILTDTTKIYRRVPKDPEALREEGKEFFAISPEEREEKRLLPPDPFERKEVSFDELFVGQRVAVFADENVKYAAEFTASSIEFHEE